MWNPRKTPCPRGSRVLRDPEGGQIPSAHTVILWLPVHCISVYHLPPSLHLRQVVVAQPTYTCCVGFGLAWLHIAGSSRVFESLPSNIKSSQLSQPLYGTLGRQILHRFDYISLPGKFPAGLCVLILFCISYLSCLFTLC